MDLSLCALQGCQNPPLMLTSSNRELWMFQNLWMLIFPFLPLLFESLIPEVTLHSSVTSSKSSAAILVGQVMTEWFEFRVSMEVPMQHPLSHCLIPNCMWNTQCKQGKERVQRNEVTLLLVMGKYQYLDLAGKFILTLMCMWGYTEKSIWQAKYRWVEKKWRKEQCGWQESWGGKLK